MKRTALSSAVLCSVLLSACSTAEIPRTVPENSASYDQTASYAQNLGRQFGILKITDAMTGTEQCASVKTETHLARNLGVTLLANSPLQDLSKSVSQGPFSTGVGLDFANLGWKNDTVYFENLDHWFAFVPQQAYSSKEAAQSYTVQALAEACADEDNLCVAANDNADGQVVLSGHLKAIEKAVEIASEFGAKRCIKLPVSAPFHSPLMQPAAEVMARALMQVEAHDAQIPLIANVLASAITDHKEIVKRLVEQVTGSVRWRESVIYMKEQGVTDVAELGAGKVLANIIKRSDKEMNAFSVGSAAEIEELAKNL